MQGRALLQWDCLKEEMKKASHWLFMCLAGPRGAMGFLPTSGLFDLELKPH